MATRARKDTITDATEVNEGAVEAELARMSATREQLHSINSWDDALALARELHGDVLNVSETELADGFRKATDEDKLRLCGVPIMIVEWSFAEGDFEDKFSVLRLIAKDASGGDSKWIVVDGGKGINRDLQDFTRRTGRMGGLLVPKGFRVSHFKINAETKETLTKSQAIQLIRDGGKTEPAMTFYLDTSA